jgi:mRNA interferase RelE/StbE
MPTYSVSLSKTAVRQLDRLPEETAETILKAIHRLAENPRPHGVKKLKGREGYRIRRGDFRIIYDIYDRQLVIEVIAIGHRKDVYD